jgi:hypothetical protein
MVPFNVAALGGGRFHRGTDGTILIDAKAAALAASLATPHLPIGTHADMRALAWASCCSTSTTRSMRSPACRCARNSRTAPGAGCWRAASTRP